jgi:hypothetical protein
MNQSEKPKALSPGYLKPKKYKFILKGPHTLNTYLLLFLIIPFAFPSLTVTYYFFNPFKVSDTLPYFTGYMSWICPGFYKNIPSIYTTNRLI